MTASAGALYILLPGKRKEPAVDWVSLFVCGSLSTLPLTLIWPLSHRQSERTSQSNPRWCELITQPGTSSYLLLHHCWIEHPMQTIISSNDLPTRLSQRKSSYIQSLHGWQIIGKTIGHRFHRPVFVVMSDYFKQWFALAVIFRSWLFINQGYCIIILLSPRSQE